MEVWIAVSLSFVGLFGFALYPVCLGKRIISTGNQDIINKHQKEPYVLLNIMTNFIW